MANFRNERSRALNVPLFKGGLRGLFFYSKFDVGRSMFDVHLFALHDLHVLYGKK